MWRRLTAFLTEDDRLLLLVLDPRARVTLGTPRATLEPTLHYIG